MTSSILDQVSLSPETQCESWFYTDTNIVDKSMCNSVLVCDWSLICKRRWNYFSFSREIQLSEDIFLLSFSYFQKLYISTDESYLNSFFCILNNFTVWMSRDIAEHSAGYHDTLFYPRSDLENYWLQVSVTWPHRGVSLLTHTNQSLFGESDWEFSILLLTLISSWLILGH